jgi:hypothetical protein
MILVIGIKDDTLKRTWKVLKYSFIGVLRSAFSLKKVMGYWRALEKVRASKSLAFK